MTVCRVCKKSPVVQNPLLDLCRNKSGGREGWDEAGVQRRKVCIFKKLRPLGWQCAVMRGCFPAWDYIFRLCCPQAQTPAAAAWTGTNLDAGLRCFLGAEQVWGGLHRRKCHKRTGVETVVGIAPCSSHHAAMAMDDEPRPWDRSCVGTQPRQPEPSRAGGCVVIADRETTGKVEKWTSSGRWRDRE